MKTLFWTCVLLMLYGYAGYPLILWLINRCWGKPLNTTGSHTPSVAVIVPVYNEEGVIAAKLENLHSLVYPRDKLEIIVVSDGSRDRTAQIVRSFPDHGLRFFELPERTGKASALNLGLKQATGDIVVFTDASIMLEPNSLHELVQPFQDPSIGCVSGEDYIQGQSGEGLYGRYELMLRNLESRVGSLVAASGCFYAQRRGIITEFKPAMAPDFFSVLETVTKGFRAVSCPAARGHMGAVQTTGHEFQRKTRTLLRGITTLMAFRHLLNPFKYGRFAWSLWSHKVLRWLGGGLLVLIFAANLALLSSPFYLGAFLLQAGFYLAALAGFLGAEGVKKSYLTRIPLFFCVTNFATLLAWINYFTGVRQELWEPSKR